MSGYNFFVKLVMKLKTLKLLLHVMELKAFELFLDLIRSPGAASRDLVVLVPFFAIIVFEDFENGLFVYAGVKPRKPKRPNGRIIDFIS